MDYKIFVTERAGLGMNEFFIMLARTEIMTVTESGVLWQYVRYWLKYS